MGPNGAPYICALFGIVLNVTVILFIIVRRRLRRQPRNIIWVGIGVSNILFVCCNLLGAIGFYLPDVTHLLCFVRFFLTGFPGATFLMNTLFSLVDRYLSIFHPVTTYSDLFKSSVTEFNLWTDQYLSESPSSLSFFALSVSLQFTQ